MHELQMVCIFLDYMPTCRKCTCQRSYRKFNVVGGEDTPPGIGGDWPSLKNMYDDGKFVPEYTYETDYKQGTERHVILMVNTNFDDAKLKEVYDNWFKATKDDCSGYFREYPKAEISIDVTSQKLADDINNEFAWRHAQDYEHDPSEFFDRAFDQYFDKKDKEMLPLTVYMNDENENAPAPMLIYKIIGSLILGTIIEKGVIFDDYHLDKNGPVYGPSWQKEGPRNRDELKCKSVGAKQFKISSEFKLTMSLTTACGEYRYVVSTLKMITDPFSVTCETSGFVPVTNLRGEDESPPITPGPSGGKAFVGTSNDYTTPLIGVAAILVILFFSWKKTRKE
ncbi:hypothetical protein J4457_00485 [Candidatus Woesearchaeota archaeon]|nr:hypothetical protein [Candidatus Woesearchaeota archaeon]